MRELGSLGGLASAATAINDDGVVVGYALTRDAQARAFRWTRHEGMVALGTIGGPSSVALGVDDAGRIVGESLAADGRRRAFLWTTERGMVDIGPVSGAAESLSVIPRK